MFLRTLIFVIFILNHVLLYSQSLSSDDFFKAARHAAFEEKNDDKAKQLAKQALLQTPQYTDIEIFLGRLYTWNKQYDSPFTTLTILKHIRRIMRKQALLIQILNTGMTITKKHWVCAIMHLSLIQPLTTYCFEKLRF